MIAGVDELIRVGLVDSTMVVLRGCGSGAVIALAAIERTTRFAGAILECPWDFLAGRELGVHDDATFMLPFRTDPVEWLATSPLRDVAQIRLQRSSLWNHRRYSLPPTSAQHSTGSCCCDGLQRRGRW